MCIRDNWNTKPTPAPRTAARGAGARAAQSAPSSATLPASGVSSPAKRWSSVEFPQPEGPVMARRSPARTRSDTPRKTSTRASPEPNPFARPSATSKGAVSGDTQGLHGGLPRGRAGRHGRDDERPEDRQHRDDGDVEEVHAERRVAHAVELGGERNEAELLEDQRDRRAESDAEERPGDAHAAPRGVPRARRSEDGRRRCQVQAGDDHDQKDGREEDEALEPQSEDQRAVLLLPRGHRDGGTERRRYRRGGVLRPHRVLQEHLVTGRPIGAEREEAPRLVALGPD